MECPGCHKKISDKSYKCPYCGKVLAAGKLNFAPKPKEAVSKATTPSLGFAGKSNCKSTVNAVSSSVTNVSTNADMVSSMATEKDKLSTAPLSKKEENTVVEQKHQTEQAELMKQKIEMSNKYTAENEHTENGESSSPLPPAENGANDFTEKKSESKSKEKKKLSLFGKKKRKKEDVKAEDGDEDFENVEETVRIVTDQMDDEISTDGRYDPNADGYYNDVLPVIAQEINKLPVENMLRILFTVIFVIGIIILLIVMQ